MSKLKLLSVLIMPIIIYSNSAKAEDVAVANASDRYFYIGVNTGISEPVVKSFKYKDSTVNKETKIRLKQSHMYGGRIGYSFYPGMMIEMAFSHQPKYRLAYTLPHIDINIPVAPGITLPSSIPATNGITRVSANSYMLNFIYEMPKLTPLEIKPSIIFGAGIAQVSIKPTISNWHPPLPFSMALGQKIPFFKVKKNNESRFTWQFGVGLARELTDNISLDLSAKVQAVHDIRIKYEKLDISDNKFKEATPIKKTIAISEFTVGLTYKLPI